MKRVEGLTRDKIVDVAIEMLDSDGENGLTFRALAARLETGPGAIYWHIANKSELLVAATDVAAAVSGADTDAEPHDAIRTVALAVFDAIDEHPWIGAQLARAPAQFALLQIYERIGRQLQALGVPQAAHFTAASALVNYIVGVGSQNATNARSPLAQVGRQRFLDDSSARLAALYPAEYPFLRSIAEQLRVHDDRAEFIAGIDLILTGITAPNP